MSMGLKALLLVCGLTASTFAAPIRVGIFNGVGTGTFWHTNVHTASNAIFNILAAPSQSRLGANLLIHRTGFIPSVYGLLSATSGAPNPEQRAQFLGALDSLDVVIFNNNTSIDRIFTDSSERDRIERFIRAKGVVSVHSSSDNRGTWEGWNSLSGGRFQNHPAADRQATLHLDSGSANDPAWKILNSGLPDTVNFLEEWFSFTTDASVIRAIPGLRVTVNIDESSYAGGMGGARAMGDHPMSWYRKFEEGGRFFYTAVGHRAPTYLDSAGTPTTPFLRRQLYNAILWAAGVDSTGNVVSVTDRTTKQHSRFADHARVSYNAGALTVSILNDEPNTVEVLGVNGGRVALSRGAGRTEHRFDALRSGAYIVVVTTGKHRVTRMAVVE
jgi:type 1 glutamine amidotransferase